MPEMYKKTIYVFAVIFTAAVFVIILTACGNLLLNGEQYASVRIDLGGVTDSRGASPRAIPETVASLQLTVTADDMDTIDQTFTGTLIELDVPAGTGRVFTLTAFGAGGLTLYSGSATTDLTGGGEVPIHIILSLLSGDTFITSFDLNINGQPSDLTYGIINDGLGAVLGVVPVGTSLTEITPVFEISGGATVELASGGEPNFTGGALTYTVTAENGSTQEYAVNITGNKLIVLDAAYYSDSPSFGRIVQIDNLQAEGWLERSGPNLGKTSNNEFTPYDIDFDIYGRIYIANNSSLGASPGGILRLDSLTDTSPKWFCGGEPVSSVAVDRVNSFIYYITRTGDTFHELRRCDYDGQNIKAYNTFVINHFNPAFAGLTVDDEGMVYYTHRPSGDNVIVKFNPAGNGSVLTSNNQGSDDLWDILFKDGYLYVTSIGSGNKVFSFDTDLVQTSEELAINPAVGPDAVTKPTRLLAVLNKAFYLIDDNMNDDDPYDRILSFDDLSVIDYTMWADTGTTTFIFFYPFGGA